MASGLRAKLNAIRATAVKEPPKRRESGVRLYTASVPADEHLFHLDPEGLRRIGWTGGAFDIRKCLFLDTETTGLSGGTGTVAFLVGIGYIEDERFAVKQYLMRDYPDEGDMLSQIGKMLEKYECVCTFNGNNFDIPLLRARFTMCRMREVWTEPEYLLDLLHPSRRTWKLRLGSCKLSRLEEFILGAPRTDDLPGSEVPRRYFDFLESGDMALLDDIVAHNRQDIITLGTLLAYLCELYAQPERAAHKEDIYSMGRALEKQGELKKAGTLYRIAAVPPPAGSIRALRADPIAEKASWQLYLLSRRNRDTEAMRETLEKMASRGQMRGKVYIELSKLYEHKYRNYTRALRYAQHGARFAGPEEHEAVLKRIERLKQKTENRRKQDNGILRQYESRLDRQKSNESTFRG